MKTWEGSIVSLMLGAAILTVPLVGSAQASNASLETWKAKVGVQLSKAMTYPRMFKGDLADSLHIVEVVIDRDGRILKAPALIRAGGPMALKRSTEACVQKLGRLPALPASLDGEQFKVRMHLIYAASAEGVQRLTAQAKRELARQSRALKIVAQEEEPPVIQLVASQ